jgi:hypothetical protein
MHTRDGKWRVQVGGLGTVVVWYRLIGPGLNRWLPSTQALVNALADVGVDLADLNEDEARTAA